MKTNKLMTLLAAAIFSAGITTAAEPDKGTKREGVPANYPLKKCVVSDEDLGSMGKPVKVTYEGTDVYLCCKSCTKDFNKEPAKFAKMVKDTEKK